MGDVCSRVVNLLMTIGTVLAFGACSSDLVFGNDAIEGSGNVETRVFDVADFDSVEISAAFQADVTVAPGSTTRVEVEADDNFFEHISIDVRGTTLVARIRGDVLLRGRHGLVTVTTPTLAAVDISGAADVTVRAASADLTSVGASGASELTLIGLDGSELDLQVEGASRLSVSGAGADRADVDASGASSVDLRELSLGSATVEVSGASSVDFGQAEMVSGSASGASEVRLDDDTAADIETSGSSTIRRR